MDFELIDSLDDYQAFIEDLAEAGLSEDEINQCHEGKNWLVHFGLNEGEFDFMDSFGFDTQEEALAFIDNEFHAWVLLQLNMQELTTA